MLDSTIGPSCLIGLIGDGIRKSRTPGMHMREGARQGLRYIYNIVDTRELGLDARDLPELLTAAERMGFNGLNITHPFKQAVIPLLHELSDSAAALGAVNTVLLKDGRRVGYNTDWCGFADGFKRALPDVVRRRVVQLGAGGAGAAVAYAAMTLGVERLDIYDIDPDRAAREAASLNGRFGESSVGVVLDLRAAMAAADGLIHCTPVGTDKHPGLPLPAAYLRRDLWVAEIVYFPLETELLRAARALGCRTADGSGMAVYQAAEAFRIFTGITPDVERMHAHFAEWDRENAPVARAEMPATVD